MLNNLHSELWSSAHFFPLLSFLLLLMCSLIVIVLLPTFLLCSGILLNFFPDKSFAIILILKGLFLILNIHSKPLTFTNNLGLRDSYIPIYLNRYIRFGI